MKNKRGLFVTTTKETKGTITLDVKEVDRILKQSFKRGYQKGYRAGIKRWQKHRLAEKLYKPKKNPVAETIKRYW